jgi:hypothetical protein
MKGIAFANVVVLACFLVALMVLALSASISPDATENLFSMMIGGSVGAGATVVGSHVSSKHTEQMDQQEREDHR